MTEEHKLFSHYGNTLFPYSCYSILSLFSFLSLRIYNILLLYAYVEKYDDEEDEVKRVKNLCVNNIAHIRLKLSCV